MSHGGLKIEDLTSGAGSGAQEGDVLRVDYRGTLTDDPSVEFDKSYDRNPFALTLGAGQVIQGWEQGLLGMKAGGKRKLTIPSDLAYGCLLITADAADESRGVDVSGRRYSR